MALIVFAALVAFLFFTHEPWRDEGQAWLWAKELSRPQDFFIVPGEGHPPLWFWLLKVFSLVLPFDAARYFNLALTFVNALLLWLLLRDRFWLFAAVLFSVFFAYFWGVMFRPYTLLVTLPLIAALLLRRNRSVAAGWVLALAVGLHFYASFIFGLWLLVELLRRKPILPMVGPALLAGAFALLAILSGRGNPGGNLESGNLLLGPIKNFAMGFALDLPYVFAPLAVAAILALLFIEFRENRLVLWCFVACASAFSLFTWIVYGLATWHYAAVPVMLLLAWALADKPVSGWRLAILMLPWFLLTIEVVQRTVSVPYSGAWAAYDALVAVSESDGIPLGPETVIVWPDFVFSGPMASHDLRVTSGNSGAEIGPTNWATRGNSDIAAESFAGDHAYYLICVTCERLEPTFKASGMMTTLIAEPVEAVDEQLSLYRVTPANS